MQWKTTAAPTSQVDDDTETVAAIYRLTQWPDEKTIVDFTEQIIRLLEQTEHVLGRKLPKRFRRRRSASLPQCLQLLAKKLTGKMEERKLSDEHIMRMVVALDEHMGCPFLNTICKGGYPGIFDLRGGRYSKRNHDKLNDVVTSIQFLDLDRDDDMFLGEYAEEVEKRFHFHIDANFAEKLQRYEMLRTAAALSVLEGLLCCCT